MNIIFDFEDVRERDMDFLMMEEFGVSQEFADIFLGKVGKAGAKVVYIYHSKKDKYKGESDLIVVTEFGGGKHAILVEDKIDADAMPYQSSRYFERADDDVKDGLYETYDVFIVAPRGYLLTNSEARLYPNSVSYEEMEAYMRKQKDEKYDFKLQMIEFALNRQNRGYERVEHKRVESFWDGYKSILNEEYPYMVCTNANIVHPGESHWPNYRVNCHGAKIVHKALQGYVDLQFPGMCDKLDVLKTALKKVGCDTTGVDVKPASKSGSIRIYCPVLDFKGDFYSQEENVRQCFKALDRIHKIAKEIKLW